MLFRSLIKQESDYSFLKKGLLLYIKDNKLRYSEGYFLVLTETSPKYLIKISEFLVPILLSTVPFIAGKKVGQKLKLNLLIVFIVLIFTFLLILARQYKANKEIQ